MKPWTRRSLLIGGALLALPFVCLGAGRTWCHMNGLPQRRVARSMALTRLYPESEGLKALGERYLEQAGATASSSTRRLEAQTGLMRAAETGCKIETASAIEQACCDDFRHGRVFVIDGWVLARTELDIAALFTVA